MAKNIIEKVPFEFKLGLYDLFSPDHIKYYHKYTEVDENGKYVYWDKVKYHAKVNKDNPSIAWYSVKFHRNQGQKLIMLRNKENIFFHYSSFESIVSHVSVSCPRRWLTTNLANIIGFLGFATTDPGGPPPADTGFVSPWTLVIVIALFILSVVLVYHFGLVEKIRSRRG